MLKELLDSRRYEVTLTNAAMLASEVIEVVEETRNGVGMHCRLPVVKLTRDVMAAAKLALSRSQDRGGTVGAQGRPG